VRPAPAGRGRWGRGSAARRPSPGADFDLERTSSRDHPEHALPLLSTLLGGGITYWVNVRQRRRTYVEDLFNAAIAAVAAAEVSVDLCLS
jgi:hypothetical protein